MVTYNIKNKLNGKAYIGQTTKDTPKDRWARHCAPCNRSAISNAIHKYGKESFNFEVLLSNISTVETLNDLEESYIKEHNTLEPNGYNLHKGGYNHIPTVDTKKRMSESWHSEKRLEGIERIRIINTGKKASDLTKLNMAKSQLGRKHSEETKKAISAGNIGKKLSETSKIKIALSHIENEENIGVRFKPTTMQYEAHLKVFGLSFSKSFSSKKLGHTKAFYMALEARKDFKEKAIAILTEKLIEKEKIECQN